MNVLTSYTNLDEDSDEVADDLNLHCYPLDFEFSTLYSLTIFVLTVLASRSDTELIFRRQRCRQQCLSTAFSPQRLRDLLP